MKRSKPSVVPQALASGLAGAVVLTLLHETARHLRPTDAPRMDVLGMRALRKLLGKAEAPQPDQQTLFNLTMASDLLSNGLYFSLVGQGKKAWWRGAALGLAEAPSNRTPETKLMTVAWYTVGGLAAAAASRLWSKARKR